MENTLQSSSRTKNESIMERCLAMLVKEVMDSQLKELGRKQRRIMQPRQYVEEFCVARLAGPRRSGHTTALINVGRRLFHNPVFIARNHNMAELLEEAAGGGVIVHSATDPLLKYSLKSSKPDSILVDGSNLDPVSVRQIMSAAEECLAGNSVFCVVFVQ